VTTILGALTLAGGITAIATIEGATSGPVFAAFVRQFLAPTLRKGQVVVLDNLAAHKSRAAREAIEARGARLLFQPQYSPELNPIEEAWSKLKAHLRTREARSVPALDAAVAEAADRITPRDAAGWFKHAGYRVNR
jgi:transposase